MTLTGYGVFAIVGNWASFFLCGWAGKLFDKFWLLCGGFFERLGNVLACEGLAFLDKSYFSNTFFFESIDLP